ncbi:tetratricopeptide (TPR) repeat protein [Pedobacter sp. UYP30]|uniref:hypothetical protein n=1 Tax=Pedobacter sp. UYP30 TaxID=1756400 RepID=UPI00339A1C47
MTKEDKILLTARYVEGDMNSFEQYEYELRLKNEPDLNEHLKDYKEIHENFRLQLPLIASQQSFFPPRTQNTKHYRVEEPDVLPVKSILKWFLAIAAGIMTVFLIWAPWNTNLYRSYAYYEKIGVPKSFLGDTVAMHKAVYLYNNGSYLLSSHLLAAQHIKNPDNAELAYAYSNTLIETAHLLEAREILETVVARNADVKYFAEYSMALSYVREDNATEAKIWLDKIPKLTKAYPVAAELRSHL